MDHTFTATPPPGKDKLPAAIWAGCRCFSEHLKEGHLLCCCLDTVAERTLFCWSSPFKLVFIWCALGILVQWRYGLERSDVLCCVTYRGQKIGMTLVNLPGFIKYTTAQLAIFILHQTLLCQSLACLVCYRDSKASHQYWDDCSLVLSSKDQPKWVCG